MVNLKCIARRLDPHTFSRLGGNVDRNGDDRYLRYQVHNEFMKMYFF